MARFAPVDNEFAYPGEVASKVKDITNWSVYLANNFSCLKGDHRRHLDILYLHMYFRLTVLVSPKETVRCSYCNEKRLLPSSCLSICLHVSVQFPLDGFL